MRSKKEIREKYTIKLTPEQLRHASYFLDENLDRLGRWHCLCGAIMEKRWNEEDKQWEWGCLKCLKWSGVDEMLTEKEILEAHAEYRKRYPGVEKA